MTTQALMESVHEGDSEDEVLKKAGTTVNDFVWNDHRGPRRGKRIDGRENPERRYRRMTFFDGTRRWDLDFEETILQNKRSNLLVNIDEDRGIFALMFQHFYLRLAIFFGCLGIFINLFRGEMLDKTLHFWFLGAIQREVLLVGKYLAGLIAAVTIFTSGAVLSYGAMLWAQDPAEVARFWTGQGSAHMFWYAASAALACVGYGSVFLASGLLLKNPIVPAIIILIWEGVNGVLPAVLQKLSVLYYVQALAPVEPPTDPTAPLLIRMLTSPAEPPAVVVAVAGLLAVTAVVLWVSARAVRRLEINYGVE